MYVDSVILKGKTAYAELDAVIELEDRVIVVECKRSQLTLVWDKLQGLYGPLVSHITGKPVILVQAFKNATHRDTLRKRVVKWEDLLQLQPGDCANWHVL